MTMKLRIDGGSTIEIKDDNTTIVSSDMKKIIEDKFQWEKNIYKYVSVYEKT